MRRWPIKEGTFWEWPKEGKPNEGVGGPKKRGPNECLPAVTVHCFFLQIPTLFKLMGIASLFHY